MRRDSPMSDTTTPDARAPTEPGCTGDRPGAAAGDRRRPRRRPAPRPARRRRRGRRRRDRDRKRRRARLARRPQPPQAAAGAAADGATMVTTATTAPAPTPTRRRPRPTAAPADAATAARAPASAGRRRSAAPRPTATDAELPDAAGEGRPSAEAAARRRAGAKPRSATRPRRRRRRPSRQGPAAAGQAATATARRRPQRRRRRRRPEPLGRRAPAGRGRRPPSRPPSRSTRHRREPVELDDETLERRRGRERKGRPVGRYLDVRARAPSGVTQIAVLEGRVARSSTTCRARPTTSRQIHGNIYLGRVQNVLPGHGGRVRRHRHAEERRALPRRRRSTTPRTSRRRASAAHRADAQGHGQTIICRSPRTRSAHKGARLTQEVSLPGRFVVMVPNSHDLRHLEAPARRRAQAPAPRSSTGSSPTDAGLIVRTAAEGVTAEELERDVRRLRRAVGADRGAGQAVEGARRCSTRSPTWPCGCIREEFTKEYRGVVIDDRALYEEVRDYVDGDRARARRAGRVLRRRGRGRCPLFERLPRPRAAPQGARPQGVAAVGRLAHHRAHRGAHGHRRQHRQERRASRTSRRRSSATTSRRPRRSPASSACATSAASSSSTSSTWRSRTNRDEVDQGVPGRAGPGQDPHPGVRHLRARPGRDDPQAHRRGPARVVQRRPARRARAAGCRASTRPCSTEPAASTSVPVGRSPEASSRRSHALCTQSSAPAASSTGSSRASASRSSGSAATTAPRSSSRPVLLVDGDTVLATPDAARQGASVTAKVVGEAKGPKITRLHLQDEVEPAAPLGSPPALLDASRSPGSRKG